MECRKMAWCPRHVHVSLFLLPLAAFNTARRVKYWSYKSKKFQDKTCSVLVCISDVFDIFCAMRCDAEENSKTERRNAAFEG
jgi:hypothetical protein